MRQTMNAMSADPAAGLRRHAAIRMGPARRLLLAVLDCIDLRMERQRTRRALMNLTDAQLKDVGLTRGDAYREGMRWFWD